MKTVEDFEAIRRAYFIDRYSICEINRKLGYDRETIRKAIVNPTPQPYQLSEPRPAPVLGPYKVRIKELLDESDKLPRKQRYTAHKIYQIIQDEGYQGSDGREYTWGDKEPTFDLCNFNKQEDRTTPVGKYSPQGDSPYGCVDMSLNVWEWTASTEGDGGRVLRGGGWLHPAENVRIDKHSIHESDECYDTEGFRCVVDELFNK